jgi:hypothetical protein
MRWKPVIDAFSITFSDRWPGAQTYQPNTPETPFELQAPRTAGGCGTFRFTAPEVTIVLRERRIDADRGLSCAATALG